MFQLDFLNRWSEKLEAMAPHGAYAVKLADYYACRTIDHLQAIEDLLRGEGDTEGTIVKTLNLVNGTPQTIDVRDDADWQLLTVVVMHPSANTVVSLTQAGVPRYAYEGAVAKTEMPAGVILSHGVELTASSVGGDVQVALFGKVCKPHRARAVSNAPNAREFLHGGDNTTDPDRHFADEATHVPTTDPYHIDVPVDATRTHRLPYPPYDG